MQKDRTKRRNGKARPSRVRLYLSDTHLVDITVPSLSSVINQNITLLLSSNDGLPSCLQELHV